VRADGSLEEVTTGDGGDLGEAYRRLTAAKAA
jgi:hypothetical protein